MQDRVIQDATHVMYRREHNMEMSFNANVSIVS